MKHLKRAFGSYEEKEFVMQIKFDKFSGESKKHYTNIYFEFKRGDR